MNDPAAANAALTAFLRGVERRGVVFAELQGGDADAGDRALAATLRGFRAVAGGAPFAEWPRRFWAMLLAANELRGPPGDAAAAPGFEHLAGLGRGPRAALLLRLVAGLAESEAAAVLGISRPTYRLALQRALPHRDDGSADPETWRALSDAAQHAIRRISGERLDGIARMQAGTWRPARPLPRAAAEPTSAPRRRAWVWPATVTVAVLTGAGLLATWWQPWRPAHDAADASRIVVEALPPAAAPAARFDPATALQGHRDLALLLAQGGEDAEAFADPAFDAWLAVELAKDPDGKAPLALPDPSAASEVDETSPEQFDAPR